MTTKSGMKSLTDLYKTGCGPSSSHTMGPEKACKIFMSKYPEADSFKVILYGSLSKTGVGHGTDRVIKKTFSPLPCDVVFNYDDIELVHPNTMDIFAYKDNVEIANEQILSVGGGAIQFVGTDFAEVPDVYPDSTFKAISQKCKDKNIRLWQYVEEIEGEEITDYLLQIWENMKNSIVAGLKDEGILPGGLEVKKRAKLLYEQKSDFEEAETREHRMVCSYAFAVSEQNACGETIVTAPTCGAAGIMPAVLYYHQKKYNFSDLDIAHALATGGVIGNLIKTNASISGSECGCQAEVGSACAMAAAALAELMKLDLPKIEYAAEVAIEHHLGLTCDPICGLVQIPCIERNAVAAMRAINAVSLSKFLSDTGRIWLDSAIKVMKQTGLDISGRYKETSEGGLAKIDIK